MKYESLVFLSTRFIGLLKIDLKAQEGVRYPSFLQALPDLFRQNEVVTHQ